MKLYIYTKCGTCRRALQFLDKKGITYETVPIREQPPTKEEIRVMLEKYGVKRLFNTSGMDYRAMNMKEKLPKLSEEDIIELLSQHGNLIKRPFVVDPLLIGFVEEEWEEVL